MPDESLPPANASDVLRWIDMAARLDLIGLRELEAQLRRQWSEPSLGPALHAIEGRRQALEHPTPVPSCAYCLGPCSKPFGWFAVERWEAGAVVRRGYACSAGCLIAVAHAQRDREASSPPLLKGALSPVEGE
jgi:hypothetical protein